MKKELPKIFNASQNKTFDNNSNFFYGEYRNHQTKLTVDDLFKPNEIYRTKVKITLKDKSIERTIIGRTQNNLITLNNEIIPISDIVEIEYD